MSLDISVEAFDEQRARLARFVGISVPMHTALRLGVRAAQRIRELNPTCHICFYGLYASLNSEYLLEELADSVIGGEWEEPLINLVRALDAGSDADVAGVGRLGKASSPYLKRLFFPVPERSGLPSLETYAHLIHKGHESNVGYVEATRGCKHPCLHCPIPPVYNGRFFAVPRDVVLEDIRQFVLAGASHITFGDPDFLNGPKHALKTVEAMHHEFPDLTLDCTAKIEHIVKHRDLIRQFAEYGCIFVVSAVESLSDEVLRNLQKGHTRLDVSLALDILRKAGIALRPSLVSFTPWTTFEDYLEVLEFVEYELLVDHVDPIQYAIRLLVPPGSMLLSSPDMQPHLGELIPNQFTYSWKHPDSRMDDLHAKVASLVEKAVADEEDGHATFLRIKQLATDLYVGHACKESIEMPPLHRIKPPRLTEPWFC